MAKRTRGWPLPDRLEHYSEQVTETGCILWTGCINASGYGILNHKGSARLAHRLAWTEAHGAIPAGLCVLHRCDTPACINVDHLFLGDNAANVQDKVRKGRARGQPGEENPNAKLTAEDVSRIRREKLRACEVRDQYGICYGHALRIVNSQSWEAAA